MGDIKKAIDFMMNVANDDTHGYDQTNRNSPDYDCSSLVGTALNYAGFKVSKYSWTGNLYNQLLECGFSEMYGVNDRKCGDIFLTPKKHVVMCIDSERIVHASINEKGKTTGGKTGDQTGKEICVRDFYIPSYGWKYHLRYIAEPPKHPAEIALEVIDGKWGNGTERYKRLTENGYNYTLIQNLVNQEIVELESDVYKIAREVIAGKWGNGNTRKEKLTKSGYDYSVIQGIVNEMLG